ncbi:hypothetical protein U9M48_010928 [Paspalum notatum var. saurae]|uniref:Reverse transcriptase zinc-binding domain-containing protein n=1 Tax=Paspalum notatum var. saurae TaxID=547442 RepID=A0AAQ3WGS0_PASNO
MDPRVQHAETINEQGAEHVIQNGGSDRPLHLVQQTFEEENAKAILAIPVHIELDDVPAWCGESKGLFSVKSAYKIQKLATRQQSMRGVTASSSSVKGFGEKEWKKLWKLRCPGKIKHLTWRMAHNTLALKMTLRCRGMDINSMCAVCRRANEDGVHLFSNAKRPKSYGELLDWNKQEEW